MDKLISISCCLVFLLLSSFSKAENAFVLNTTGKPPLNTLDGRGFMDLVAKEAFRRINSRLNTIQLPAERGLKNANAGIEDGEMSRVAGLENIYPNLIRVPEKIMDWYFVAFSKQDIELSNGWQDLEPYSIAYINGWKILEKNITFPGVIKVRDPEQLFELLIRDRTEMMIYEQWGGLYQAKIRQLKNIKMLNPPLAIKPMYIYLHKKHHQIVPKLSRALKSMKSDGSYQKIENEILNPLRTQKP